MPPRIQDDAIRQVRERASLADVVGDVVALRRRGRSLVGLCPFHAEKTPSFTVSEERGFYHCFGCGEHGDVFGFVMKTQALAFPEAVRQVAHRFGIAVPEAVGEAGRGREPLAAANAAAAAFFREQLAGAAGVRARAYLAERGLTDETVGRFRLGYAPAGGDALVRHLRAHGVAIEDAVAAGVLARRDRGDAYDRFRDRLMFPITDTSGKVIAFGGRILPGARPVGGDPPPKYLNSPESPVFRKGHTLYGLAEARDAIRRSGRALVVEGYVDVLTLVQAGTEEVVAPLGTALTADQLRLLRRFTETVVACFDGDAAGRRAAARSFPVFVDAGLWGRGAFLPAGEDPDTFVRAGGRDALEAVLARAEPLVEAFIAELAGPDHDAVGRRADAAREIARLLKRVQNPFEHDILARLAAERLGVREEVLRREGMPSEGGQPHGVPAVPAGAGPRSSAGPGGPEALLVELMAEDASVANRVAASGVIAEFQHAEWRRTAEALASAGREGDRAALLDVLPRDVRDRVVTRLLDEEPGAVEERERALADCIAAIRRRRLERTVQRLREELRAAESRGDAPAATAALREIQRLLAESGPTEKARP